MKSILPALVIAGAAFALTRKKPSSVSTCKEQGYAKSSIGIPGIQWKICIDPDPAIGYAAFTKYVNDTSWDNIGGGNTIDEAKEVVLSWVKERPGYESTTELISGEVEKDQSPQIVLSGYAKSNIGIPGIEWRIRKSNFGFSGDYKFIKDKIWKIASQGSTIEDAKSGILNKVKMTAGYDKATLSE